MLAVIFDMDGTLLDTQRICVPAWEWAGANQGLKGLGQHIPNVCGHNEPSWTKYLVDNFPTLNIPVFKKDVHDYIEEHLVVRFKSGGKQLLEFLKTNGFKIALASGSSHTSIDHHLNEVGATDFFDVTVGGVDVQNGKPAPDIFLLAAEQLGVEPKDCFVLEDSSNGIRAGYAAGMKCIGIPDLVQFPQEIKDMMYAELSSMEEAIPLFASL